MLTDSVPILIPDTCKTLDSSWHGFREPVGEHNGEIIETELVIVAEVAS